MASEKTVHVDISVDPSDVKTGALEIMKRLRPNWPQGSIRLKTFTDGITNVLCGAYLDGQFPNNTIMVRVYGEKTELIIDREVEMNNIQLLHAAGCGPPLYCTFNNGVCYGFLPGQPLDEVLVRDDHIKRLIAYETARVHSISLEKVHSFIVKDPEAPVRKEPCLWVKAQKYIDLVPEKFSNPEMQERYKKNVKPKAELQHELNELRANLEHLNSTVVFCHNDMLCKNLIYNDKEDKVYFIDYEYGDLNYAAFDIGDHFCEYAGVDEVDYTRYPDKKYQLDWLRIYISYCNQLSGKPEAPITDKQVETLYVQVNKFSLMAHFFWGLWALIQANVSTIDFDYLEYAIIRLNEYFARKESFLALKLPE